MATVTTTVALVGPASAASARQLVALASNVSVAAAPDLIDDPIEDHGRLLTAWREARRHPPVYTLVGSDPLQAVIDAWARQLSSDTSELETLIGLTPTDPAPHYYLVDAGLVEPLVHWYQGLLAPWAGTRVITVKLEAASILGALTALPTGRELPTLGEIATMARSYVPLPGLTIAG